MAGKLDMVWLNEAAYLPPPMTPTDYLRLFLLQQLPRLPIKPHRERALFTTSRRSIVLAQVASARHASMKAALHRGFKQLQEGMRDEE